MSDLQMQQEDHPIHDVPPPTEDYRAKELPLSMTPNTGNQMISDRAMFQKAAKKGKKAKPDAGY